MNSMKLIVIVSLFASSISNALAVEIVNRPYIHAPAVIGSHDNNVQPVVPQTAQSAVATPVAIQEVTPAKQWKLQYTDVNYSGAFQRWAEVAGYQVRWDAKKHFIIEGVSTFSGSFEDAVTAVLSNPAVTHSTYPLEVCFYPNTPPLARITRRGEQLQECK